MSASTSATAHTTTSGSWPRGRRPPVDPARARRESPSTGAKRSRTPRPTRSRPRPEPPIDVAASRSPGRPSDGVADDEHPPARAVDARWRARRRLRCELVGGSTGGDRAIGRPCRRPPRRHRRAGRRRRPGHHVAARGRGAGVRTGSSRHSYDTRPSTTSTCRRPARTGPPGPPDALGGTTGRSASGRGRRRTRSGRAGAAGAQRAARRGTGRAARRRGDDGRRQHGHDGKPPWKNHVLPSRAWRRARTSDHERRRARPRRRRVSLRVASGRPARRQAARADEQLGHAGVGAVVEAVVGTPAR